MIAIRTVHFGRRGRNLQIQSQEMAAHHHWTMDSQPLLPCRTSLHIQPASRYRIVTITKPGTPSDDARGSHGSQDVPQNGALLSHCIDFTFDRVCCTQGRCLSCSGFRSSPRCYRSRHHRVLGSREEMIMVEPHHEPNLWYYWLIRSPEYICPSRDPRCLRGYRGDSSY